MEVAAPRLIGIPETDRLGFVFVTEEGGKPVPFANGSRGNQVAPWIKKHSYVFELYGDDQRQTLLAKVTVSGSAESASSQQTVSWQVVARWALIIGLAAVLYFAVYLSSTGPVRTTFPTEPTTSPRQLHVGRNLLLGIAAFICVDGAIFHSGLYVSILAPSSYAGRVGRITRAEKKRAPSGLKEVLVLGDSRIAEGFSATLANELGSPAGLKFVSLAEPAASANTWYYMVREVDPTTRRYSAIIIPYGIGYEPNSADPLRISMTAPLLRYGDCFHFASGFQRWSGRFRAFIACILRGSAYQDDVVDLLAHPVARIRSIQQADKTHSGSGVQRTGLRSCGDILRCSDRTGNVRAKINRSSEVGFPEELDTTIAVGHGVLRSNYNAIGSLESWIAIRIVPPQSCLRLFLAVHF